MQIIKRQYIQLEMTEFEFATIQAIIREAYYNAKDGEPIQVDTNVIEKIHNNFEYAERGSSIQHAVEERQRDLDLFAAADDAWTRKRVKKMIADDGETKG